MGAKKGDGMANHHLIPEEVMNNPMYKDLFANAKRSGFDGDGASNGTFLPGSKDLAQKTGLPGHWSNHKNYTADIDAKVNALNNMFKRGELSDSDVVIGLGNIQRNARDGLNNGVFSVDPVTGRLD